jgi:hypothetical protein
MRLLVSPMNVEEAKIAVRGGADIIDVKNPKEGSLGANFPWVIRSVKEAIGDVTMSATIGDFDYKPGTASLAALGAAMSGAEYIKVGLRVKRKEQAVDIIKNVVRSLACYPEKKIVAAGYSDYDRIGAFNPFELLEEKLEMDVIMFDTGIKDGKSTFDLLCEEKLIKFVTEAKEMGLETAIAGSIKFEDIGRLKRANPDIVGVRGMVCGGNRNACVREELVIRLKNMIR